MQDQDKRTVISSMRAKGKPDLTFVFSVLFVLRGLQGVVSETVYFNSYRDCTVDKSFFLDDMSYVLLATGAPEIHETLICNIRFRAPQDTGICLTFKSFKVDDCDVSLSIYQSPNASGRKWKKLTCENNGKLPQICTPERYVTLLLKKGRLNNNQGYSFEITVDKSSNLTGEDVILASSIGLFVGIIAGVVALIIILSAIVMCCCCKPCRAKQQQQQQLQHQQEQLRQQQCVEPSAPPVPEDDLELTPLQQGGVDGLPLYPNLPHQHPHYPGGGGYRMPEPPPPYAPPPYEESSYPTKG